MAIINFHYHARASHRRNIEDHHVARNINVQPRDTTTNPEGVPVVNPLPVSVRVLTAFFVILGVVVLGIVTWRIVVWRRRKVMTASQKYREGDLLPSEKIRPIVNSTPLEKQEVLVILPMEPPPSVILESGRWKPQIPAGRGVMDKKAPAPAEATMSPPPTYTATSSPAARSRTPSPTPRPPALNLPTVTVTHDTTKSLTVPPVSTTVVSPRRTSSFVTDAPGMGGTDGMGLRAKPSVKSVKGEKVPRKMRVEHTFIPSLADELAIRVGEVLCMLEEYEDEWCLVERVGTGAGERGVVPRFCLKERTRGHKRGMSSASVKTMAARA